LLLNQIRALQQAGRWRDVKPALDLFVCSKMRSILARARQLYSFERAMQQLEHMQSEGAKPNSVLFNTLLDACAKRGIAHNSVALLQQMEAAGVAPDAISYNFVINACSKAGQHKHAVAVLKQMRLLGLTLMHIATLVLLTHVLNVGRFTQHMTCCWRCK
jgi:pentatricopeptide repeat protein